MNPLIKLKLKQDIRNLRDAMRSCIEVEEYFRLEKAYDVLSLVVKNDKDN